MSMPLYLISSHVNLSRNSKDHRNLYNILRKYSITQNVHNKLQVYNYVSIHSRPMIGLRQAIIEFSRDPPTEEPPLGFTIKFQNHEIISNIDVILRQKLELDTSTIYKSLMYTFETISSQQVKMKHLYRLRFDMERHLHNISKTASSSFVTVENAKPINHDSTDHKKYNVEDLESDIDIQRLRNIYSQSNNYDGRNQGDNKHEYLSYDSKLSQNKKLQCMTTESYIQSKDDTFIDRICLAEIERILCNIIKRQKWTATSLEEGTADFSDWDTITEAKQYFTRGIRTIETEIWNCVTDKNFELLIIHGNLLHRYNPTFILPLFIKQHKIVLNDKHGKSVDLLKMLWNTFKIKKNFKIQPSNFPTVFKTYDFWSFITDNNNSISNFIVNYPIEAIDRHHNTFLYLVYYYNISNRTQAYSNNATYGSDTNNNIVNNNNTTNAHGNNESIQNTSSHSNTADRLNIII